MMIKRIVPPPMYMVCSLLCWWADPRAGARPGNIDRVPYGHDLDQISSDRPSNSSSRAVSSDGDDKANLSARRRGRLGAAVPTTAVSIRYACAARSITTRARRGLGPAATRRFPPGGHRRSCREHSGGCGNGARWGRVIRRVTGDLSGCATQ